MCMGVLHLHLSDITDCVNFVFFRFVSQAHLFICPEVLVHSFALLSVVLEHVPASLVCILILCVT